MKRCCPYPPSHYREYNCLHWSAEENIAHDMNGELGATILSTGPECSWYSTAEFTTGLNLNRLQIVSLTSEVLRICLHCVC